jgi:hypothetical protein
VLLLYVKKRAMAANPFYTMVVAGVLGCCCYQLLPAAGPVHVFHGFPNGLPAQVSLTAEPLPWIPRNAIPSLHTAWALLVYWAVAKYSRPVRWAAAVFVLLTLLATLGFGEHYLIDLVVAVPFAVAVQAFCARHWVQSGVCLAGTLAWLIYLRFGLPHAAPSVATTWILTAISVAPGLFWVPGRVEESSRRAERKVQQVPSLADVPGTR